MTKSPLFQYVNDSLAASQKQSGCTHMRLTRLYDNSESQKCPFCQRAPSLGWLYRCTQETDGFLPRCDFDSTGISGAVNEVSDNDPNLLLLSRHITDAINRGQYSEDQINVLMHQKEQVRCSILGTNPRSVTPSSSSSTSDLTISTSLPASPTLSTTSSGFSDGEICVACDWSASNLYQPVTLDASPCERKDEHDRTRHPSVTSCSLKICPTCRPSYRERSFQSIDDIVTSPFLPPPLWETNNRRLSSARILSQTCISVGTQCTNSDVQGDREIKELKMNENERVHDDPSFGFGNGMRKSFRKFLNKAGQGNTAPNANDQFHRLRGPNSRSTQFPNLFSQRRSRSETLFAESQGHIVDSIPLRESILPM